MLGGKTLSPERLRHRAPVAAGQGCHSCQERCREIRRPPRPPSLSASRRSHWARPRSTKTWACSRCSATDVVAEPGYLLLDAVLTQDCARDKEVSEADSVAELGVGNRFRLRRDTLSALLPNLVERSAVDAIDTIDASATD